MAGATGGIGRALVTELAGRGARLVMVGRDRQRLERLAEHGIVETADLRMPEACERVIATTMSQLGSIDVVINAVGVVAFGDVVDLSVDTMEELFLTNTFLPIMLARAALPRISAGGAIVNISGVIAEQNLPGLAAYGASKAALRSFDVALSREARRRRVRVIDARPPHTETGLASRPLDGTAPRMPTGLAPARVATVICDALENGVDDLPSTDF